MSVSDSSSAGLPSSVALARQRTDTLSHVPFSLHFRSLPQMWLPSASTSLLSVPRVANVVPFVASVASVSCVGEG